MDPDAPTKIPEIIKIFKFLHSFCIRLTITYAKMHANPKDIPSSYIVNALINTAIQNNTYCLIPGFLTIYNNIAMERLQMLTNLIPVTIPGKRKTNKIALSLSKKIFDNKKQDNKSQDCT